MILRSLVLVVLLAAVSVEAFETGETVLALKPEIQRGDLQHPQGLWPLLGAGLGVMDHNDQIRSGGTPLHVKLMGSYYFDNQPFVADAGLGLHNEFLSQNGPGADTIQSLYTELSGRYKFANRWQLGAIWNTLVDNPDRYRSNTNNLASFVGVQALKEFVWSDTYLVRAGGRIMTDVGISGETIDTAMAELQVSFGPSAPKVAEQPKPAPAPAPVAPHLARQAIQTFDFDDPGPVHFETDSTKLVPSSAAYLRRLSRALADNRHLFERVSVVGHADQRGTEPHNLKLSRRRAQAIRNVLATSGLKSTQIHFEGRGESELLSRSMASMSLQRNRRVQLEFHGVKNNQALKNVVDSVTH
jgi:outer membrane protein OmpA-like peptidoglycan-associated protein